MSKAQNVRWKGCRLYHNDVPVMEIEQHLVYSKMYYVVWPDGVKSVDFYRIEYAKQHCKVEAGLLLRYEPVEEFKP